MQKEWYTLEIITKDKVYYISKVGADDLDDIMQLYLNLEFNIGDFFDFRSEFVEVQS